MSLIPCSLECSHQREGYCCLETCAPVTNSAGGCPHFVGKQAPGVLLGQSTEPEAVLPDHIKKSPLP